MSVLVDTNVLLRLAQPASPHHASAQAALIQLAGQQAELCLVPQIIYEYWSVATRPVAVNELGMSSPDVERSIEMLLADFSLRRDERGIFAHWMNLVSTHDVRGKNSHDARLVASMIRHGIADLLTFNDADFLRFTEIQVWTPARILAGAFRG